MPANAHRVAKKKNAAKACAGLEACHDDLAPCETRHSSVVRPALRLVWLAGTSAKAERGRDPRRCSSLQSCTSAREAGAPLHGRAAGRLLRVQGGREQRARRRRLAGAAARHLVVAGLALGRRGCGRRHMRRQRAARVRRRACRVTSGAWVPPLYCVPPAPAGCGGLGFSRSALPATKASTLAT